MGVTNISLGCVHRKNIKTYLSRPEKKYLWRSGWRSTIQGSRHTRTLKKKTVSNIVSSPSLNSIPPPCWLSCCLPCWLLRCCHYVNIVFVYIVAALPTPQPPPSARRCRRRHWLVRRMTRLLHKHRQQSRQVDAPHQASEGRCNKEGECNGDEGGKR
jgi:hypothetical protein